MLTNQMVRKWILNMEILGFDDADCLEKTLNPLSLLLAHLPRRSSGQKSVRAVKRSHAISDLSSNSADLVVFDNFLQNSGPELARSVLVKLWQQKQM